MPAVVSSDTVTKLADLQAMWTAGLDSCVLTLHRGRDGGRVLPRVFTFFSKLEEPQDALNSVFDRAYL